MKLLKLVLGLVVFGCFSNNYAMQNNQQLFKPNLLEIQQGINYYRNSVDECAAAYKTDFLRGISPFACLDSKYVVAVNQHIKTQQLIISLYNHPQANNDVRWQASIFFLMLLNSTDVSTINIDFQ